MFSRRSWRPSRLQASTTLVISGALRMSSWKSALTTSKRLESSGSWTRMSAEPTKMDSSACHFFCTSPHVLMTLSTVPRFFCQRATASRNMGLVCTYFCPDMFCSCRLSFSSASVMASSICSAMMSVSWYGEKPKLSAAHVSSIFLSCFSMLSSFCARSTISEPAST